MIKIICKVLFASLFIGGGINHFRDPDFYLQMMPPFIPYHELMVQLSGIAEIGLGLLLLIPRFSAIAAWGLVLLLIAVFPANLYMAMNPELFPDLPQIGLWLRLPIQGLLIWWAWIYTGKKSKH